MINRQILKRRFINFLLVYFLLYTSYFSLITLSQYIDMTEKNGSVSIAKWEVELDNTISNSSLDIVHGNDSQSYIFKVISKSEVAAKYSIKLSNLPEGIKVSIDNKEFYNPIDNQLIFDNVGSFIANDSNSIHEHIITFSMPLDSIIEGIKDVNFDLILEQNTI